MAKTYYSDYPVELIATLAARLLDFSNGTDDQAAFVVAAERACKLLDVCEEVGGKHYKTVNDLRPIYAPLRKMLKNITGIEGRPGYALKRYREFFQSRVRSFVHSDDDQSIPVESLESAAYKRMMKALEVHEQRGIHSDELHSLKKAFKEWLAKNTSAVRRNAAAMRKPTKKRSAEDLRRTKEGKFKKKIA